MFNLRRITHMSCPPPPFALLLGWGFVLVMFVADWDDRSSGLRTTLFGIALMLIGGFLFRRWKHR